MKRMSLFLVVSILAAMILAACGGSTFTCEDEFGCVTYGPEDPIHIATALVISGPNESLGTDSQRGVEIAIIDKGEVLGHKIKHTAEDGQCSAEGGQAAATKIASDQTVIAVIGHNCSSSCTPAGPIYSEAGITMISPSCTAPSLTLGDRAAFFFRSCHNDSVQGKFAADFFYGELGLRTAATIHDGSPYAEQLANVFAENFAAKGGTITSQQAVNVGDTDMRPVLTTIAVDSPEVIYYPIFVAEGGFITRQAKEVGGLEGSILAGADGIITPDFVEAAGEASEGMYFTGPDLSFENDLYNHFLEVYQSEYGTAPTSVFHAHAYDAANMIFQAIEEVAVVEDDGTIHIGRKALRDAVEGIANFEGITGTLNCDEVGDCADPKVNVSQLQGGEYVVVWAP
jgi:branched-chain amino acid transport system substrate-binding protein